MTILVAALAVAFAAFCVWLTVRIVNRRERWAKRLSVAIVAVLIAYPLSLGPWFWLYRHGYIPKYAQDVPIYAPIQWVEDQGPAAVADTIAWYMHLWYRPPD